MTDAVTKYLKETLEACLNRGMQAPLIVCSISPNGSVLCVRMHVGNIEPDILAENCEEGGFRLPITIAVVDQRGEAARISFEGERPTFH
jgi:hypothetical protein